MPWAPAQPYVPGVRRWNDQVVLSGIAGIKQWTGTTWRVLPCRVDDTGLGDFSIYPLKHYTGSGWELANG